MDIQSLKSIGSVEGVRAGVLFVFLVIILATFIKFLIRPDTEEKSMQKIIGGLAVFCVALVSENPGVIGISLFIGGLIIASEKFMKSLAAILKSQSADLPETINALNEPEIYIATEEEIKQKDKEDETAAKLPEHQTRITEMFPAPVTRYDYEQSVANFFKARFGALYETNVKLQNQYGNMVYDGIIRMPGESGQVARIVEVKSVFKSGNEDLGVYKYLIRRSLERVRFLYLTHKLILAFVIEGGSDQLWAQGVAEDLEKRYEGVEVAMFGLQNGELKPLRIPAINLE